MNTQCYKLISHQTRGVEPASQTGAQYYTSVAGQRSCLVFFRASKKDTLPLYWATLENTIPLPNVGLMLARRLRYRPNNNPLLSRYLEFAGTLGECQVLTGIQVTMKRQTGVTTFFPKRCLPLSAFCGFLQTCTPVNLTDI